jgi:BON domain
MNLVKTATDVVTLPARLGLRLAASLFEREETPPTPPRAPAPTPPSAASAHARRRPSPAPPRPRPRRRAPKDIGDPAIARKVESAIFSDSKVDKGKIDVNVADGVVWLRGEARTPDLINELERKAGEIPEVKSVENLLHLPKTPAPSRTDTPPSQRKTRRSPRRQGQRKVTETGVTEESPPGGPAPTPADIVKARSARRPDSS